MASIPDRPGTPAHKHSGMLLTEKSINSILLKLWMICEFPLETVWRCSKVIDKDNIVFGSMISIGSVLYGLKQVQVMLKLLITTDKGK